jgi:hypothetical protein
MFQNLVSFPSYLGLCCSLVSVPKQGVGRINGIVVVILMVVVVELCSSLFCKN